MFIIPKIIINKNITRRLFSSCAVIAVMIAEGLNFRSDT